MEISSEIAHTGVSSLKSVDRTKNWNGPTLDVTKYIQAGTKYSISLWVRADEYATVTLSAQEGEGAGASYANIATTAVSPEAGWVELSGEYRFNSTEYATIYVESGSWDMSFYIDDVCFAKPDAVALNFDPSLPSLKAIYKDYFLVGNVVSDRDLTGSRADALKHHFDILTPENAMKPGSLSMLDGVYDYSSADKLVDFAAEAGLLMHGHTLAWHQQSAPWLAPEGTDYAQARKNLEAYIANVATHYDGKVISWDVVNEAINDGAGPVGWKDALRKSPWYTAYENGGNGWDYIEDAFRFAKKYAPDAVLYYNDYNLDNPDKASAVASMVKSINEKYQAEGGKGLLIDGIGMQGHYSLDTKPENVEASINRFTSLGVEVSITELDVTADAAAINGMTEALAKSQGRLYAQLMLIFKKHSEDIKRVTFWGIDDGTSWRAPRFPCLFNEDLTAKEAFYSVSDPEGYLER